MKKLVLFVMLATIAFAGYGADNGSQSKVLFTSEAGDTYSLSTTYVHMSPGLPSYVYVLKNGRQDNSVPWTLTSISRFNFEIAGVGMGETSTGPITVIQSPDATGPDMYGSFTINISGFADVTVDVDYR